MTAAIVGLIGVLFGGAVTTLLRAILVDRPAAQNDGWAKMLEAYSRQVADMGISIARLEEQVKRGEEWRHTAEQRINDLESEVDGERSIRQGLVEYVRVLQSAWVMQACTGDMPEPSEKLKTYL